MVEVNIYKGICTRVQKSEVRRREREREWRSLLRSEASEDSEVGRDEVKRDTAQTRKKVIGHAWLEKQNVHR